MDSGFAYATRAGMTGAKPPHISASLVGADIGDAQHVGRAGRAERDAGDDDDALAGAGKAVAKGDPAGAVDHVVDVMGGLGNDAMHAPDQCSLRPVVMFGVIATTGGFGRSRATRMRGGPELVQQMIADRSSVSAICRAASAIASPAVASGSARCELITVR